MFPIPNPALEPDEPNWEGCDYSKCGRTDKGVSAFGQVIGIKVRSNQPLSRALTATSVEEEGYNYTASGSRSPSGSRVSEDSGLDEDTVGIHHIGTSTPESKQPVLLRKDLLLFDPIKDELRYCQILNRLLPPDIRMLAWCPDPPANFSARFSCRERRYKYFFTQPAFSPTTDSHGLQDGTKGTSPGSGRRREGWLDIHAMRTAASKFVGLHDFRNFCKIDASKQIENFERRIFHADIEEMDTLSEPVGYIGLPGFKEFENLKQDDDPPLSNDISEIRTPKLYTFTLHGSAFLWHQVRHMVGILFLIGQGLESPDLIDELLNVQKNPRKPQYEMADDAPLVLWDCIFPEEDSDSREDSLNWIYVGDPANPSQKTAGKSDVVKNEGRYGVGGVVDEMWKVWRGRKMDEVLAGSLLDVIVKQGNHSSDSLGSEIESNVKDRSRKSQQVFQGGDGPRLAGRYVPVLEKPRMESVEVINTRYAQKKISILENQPVDQAD